MATIEELLGLSKEGWKDIAEMSEDQLKVYLADITKLEPRPSAVNILPKDETSDVVSDETEVNLSGTELDKLKAAGADDDSPFAKLRKAKAKRKKAKFILNAKEDEEFDDLRRELGM